MVRMWSGMQALPTSCSKRPRNKGKGRGVSAAAVKADFGGGRMLFAKEAAKAKKKADKEAARAAKKQAKGKGRGKKGPVVSGPQADLPLAVHVNP